MQRFAAAVALTLLIPQILPASEFDWLVREFSRESGAQRTHIPFLGLARFAVAVTHPAGTSQLNLALFEHADLEPQKFRLIADSVVGSNWKPMIRVVSRAGESTNIYAQTDRDHLRLLITNLDHGEATFVQVRVKPECLMHFVDEHSDRKNK